MAKKFPYPGYTPKELYELETNYYFIQMGGDFVVKDTFSTFTRLEVFKLYNAALKDLKDTVLAGSDKDKKYALELIGSLRVLPVRIH